MELTYNDNNVLIEKAQNGDKKAFNLSFELNRPLVTSVCKKFFYKGHETEDILQIGNIGLTKAIQKFNSKEYDVKFSTYAVPMIMGEVQRFLRDTNPIKIPRPLLNIRNKVKHIGNLLENKLNRSPTIEEIAVETGFTIAEVEEGIKLSNSSLVQSIEKVICGDSTTPITLSENIEGDTFEEDTILTNVLVQDAIKQLETRFKDIIKLRYFQNKTQVETSKILEITQVQVSRLEKKALNMLREILSVQKYKENKRDRRRIGEMSKKEKAFKLFKQGFTNKEVSKELGITMASATTYRSNWNKEHKILINDKQFLKERGLDLPTGAKVCVAKPKEIQNQANSNKDAKEVSKNVKKYIHNAFENGIKENDTTLTPTVVEGVMRYIKRKDEAICIEELGGNTLGNISIDKSKLDLFIQELQEIKAMF